MASVSEMYDVGWEEMRDKLRKWREDNCRNSEQIVDVGEELIGEHSSKLGDDIWIIYEQVMIAALDCSRDDLALTCLQELRKQFPDSHRVKRLSGMRLEALERYDEANKHYDTILQDDPTNTAARKRKISILKAQGKSAEAIRELNEYLEHYGKAAFCLEELMMTNPHNHLYCEQYAEVKYTQGGLENLELSRKYFAQALRLNNRNMRALFGLYMSASHIAASPKVSAKVKKDNMKYAAWAATQINRAYKRISCGLRMQAFSGCRSGFPAPGSLAGASNPPAYARRGCILSLNSVTVSADFIDSASEGYGDPRWSLLASAGPRRFTVQARSDRHSPTDTSRRRRRGLARIDLCDTWTSMVNRRGLLHLQPWREEETGNHASDSGVHRVRDRVRIG
ncbi:hypothetical protein F2P81_001589 [Scophthalmus maximus]|uniref:ER membrane protein complex subunit 2 n=1 Tax=Scophthalmus maximus TaxID=52904 RepID=A0A6A4TN88_SCOMX|nr:hypothetical protein F2P81_001589 [Scophthalmus maximus]